MMLAAHGRRTIWDLAIVVLGLNIWVSFLLLPVLHLDSPGPGAALVTLVFAALACLGIGAWQRRPVLLLGGYPLLLLLPVVSTPQLVGVNVYTPWTFVLVAVSFLAYLVGVPLLLQLSGAPSLPEEERPLEQASQTPKWARRLRIYRWLAALAGLFPAVLVGTMFLHPGVRADVSRSFPGRVTEASALFGVLILLLWLGLFNAYFLAPLKAHIHGDPQLRYELQRLRRDAFRRQVKGSFYFFVTAALVLMLLLVLAHW